MSISWTMTDRRSPFEVKRTLNQFSRVLALALAAFAVVPVYPAQAYSIPAVFDFEGTSYLGWQLYGGGGIDRGLGNAHTGQNNAFLYASSGWNSLTSPSAFVGWGDTSNKTWKCQGAAYVRASANVTSFYFSILNPKTGAIIKEVGPLSGSQLNAAADITGYARIYTGLFDMVGPAGGPNPGDRNPVLLRLGFWGNGQNAWVQVDDVAFNCDAGGNV
jgi:hypothetical protein